MTTKIVSIGIDISKAFLDVDGGESALAMPRRVPNDLQGIATLISHVQAALPTVIVCEPSGGYERALMAALVAAALPVVLVNARQVRDFARAKGILAKTDRIDAAVLSAYGAMFLPKPATTHKPETLLAYARRRAQLVAMVRQEKQQCELALADIRARMHAHIDWLKDEIGALDRRIAETIAADVALTERRVILTSCSGVGDVTAATLIAELPQLGQANHAQIAALAGLAPFNRDSGNWRGQRHIRGGNAHARRALYMATITAIRHNPDIAACYRRLIARGKAAKVAITACMRKLLITLNALIRDRRTWSPSHA
jgi:transposase